MLSSSISFTRRQFFLSFPFYLIVNVETLGNGGLTCLVNDSICRYQDCQDRVRVVTSTKMRFAVLVENDFQVLSFCYLVIKRLFSSPSLAINIVIPVLRKSWTVFKMARKHDTKFSVN